MIPARLFLRTVTIKPVLVPIGIRIIRRTQATLAEALSSSLQEPPILESSIAASNPPNQAGIKNTKKSKSEKERELGSDPSPSVRVVKAPEETSTKKKRKASEPGVKVQLEPSGETTTKKTKKKKASEPGELKPSEDTTAKKTRKKKASEPQGEVKLSSSGEVAVKIAKKTKKTASGPDGEIKPDPSEETAAKKSREKKASESGEIIELDPSEKVAVKKTKKKALEPGGEINLNPAGETTAKKARKKKASESRGKVKHNLSEEVTVKKTKKKASEPDGEINLNPSGKTAVNKTRKKKKGLEDGPQVPEAVRVPLPTAEAITLRDYQQECIDAVLDHVKQGHRRLAISLATGSGKTVIFTQLIDRLPPLNESATQTLILVHRKELLEQALRHSINTYPEKIVEVEMANKHASGMADITVASIQSLVSKGRIEKFNPRNFKLILIDECHHAVADTYMRALDHFGALHPEKSRGEHPVVVGVSATLSRHDGLKMGTVLDYIVYHKDYLDMIKDNWLSNVHFTTVQTHVDLSAVRQTKGDFNIADLSLAVNTPQTNQITVRAWLEKAGQRKSTLVFCVDIAHVTEMTNTFRRHGIDARFVTSLTPRDDRSQTLDEFRNGVFPVLVNCGILTEGTDIPNIDCVLLARPTRSKNLLIQMIGRGMRLSPGKQSCHVIDMIGVLNRGVLSTPSLFGLDPFTVVDEATPEQMETMRKEQGLEILQAGSLGSPDEVEKLRDLPIKHILFTDYESIWDLLGDTAHEKQIRQISTFAWVKVGVGNDFVLSTTGLVLRITRQPDGTYAFMEKPAVQFNIFANQFVTPPIRVIADSFQTLEHAVSGADTYAAEHCPRNMILHSAPWRKMPASDAQIKQLKKAKPEGDWDQKKLTKGQAGDILTRMRYGFTKLERALKQAQKEKEAEVKALNIRRKSEIKVGPLLGGGYNRLFGE